jgi:hypothetical protein
MNIHLLNAGELLDGSLYVADNVELVLVAIALGVDLLEGHIDNGHHHVDQDHVHHNCIETQKRLVRICLYRCSL